MPKYKLCPALIDYLNNRKFNLLFEILPQITWRAEEASKRKSNPSAKSKFSLSKKYDLNLHVEMTWALSCSFSNLDSCDAMDPESLWEVIALMFLLFSLIRSVSHLDDFVLVC